MQNKPSPEKPKSAQSCYGERLAECKRFLKRIEAQLERHSVRQVATPQDWSHAGSLGHVTEELANIVAFLGDEATENEAQPQEETRR